MSFKLFITGTDTNVGKTYISVGILRAFNALNYRTIGLKPLATGCHLTNGILYNEDALALQAAASVPMQYAHVNPFAFAPPIAPHIAAAQQKVELNCRSLQTSLQPALEISADLHLIEGAGGWLLPLNEKETMADFIIHYQFPVILVVGIRLGCLNHALLTFKAMQHQSVKIIGWVANCIDPSCLQIDDNITTLEKCLPIPCVGIVPHQGHAESQLNIALIKERLNTHDLYPFHLKTRLSF